MLTKILTAAVGLMLALMVLRFFAGRAHRAQLRERSEARQRREAEAEAARESGPDARVDPRHDADPKQITLEIDPDTGVYRPKG